MAHVIRRLWTVAGASDGWVGETPDGRRWAFAAEEGGWLRRSPLPEGARIVEVPAYNAHGTGYPYRADMPDSWDSGASA